MKNHLRDLVVHAIVSTLSRPHERTELAKALESELIILDKGSSSFLAGLDCPVCDTCMERGAKPYQFWHEGQSVTWTLPAWYCLNPGCARICMSSSDIISIASGYQLSRLVNNELAGQIYGYWFEPGARIPSSPVGCPTGAVLPRLWEDLNRSETFCLDLVTVEGRWLVLSELGRHTHLHSSGLLRRERWRFVPVPEAVDGEWPAAFSACFVDSIGYANIEECYGQEATRGARADSPSVQLRLVPRADFEVVLG
jgi:hypothetical protein